ARDHLNRIITPFERAKPKTTSNASIESSMGVIYVQPADDRPVVLYIREEGTENPTIAVTLIPKAIPPRELRLTVSDEVQSFIRSAQGTGSAEGRAKNPYVESLIAQLRRVAQGEIPSGFVLRKPSADDPGTFCMDPGLKLIPGQVIDGR